MANTIFFAWQLDVASSECKKPIWKAVCDAADALTVPADPLLSPRPEIDTQGASGSPNIIQTIFKRIGDCSVFVGDLSFVAETSDGKRLPNPNVLLELGYAARCIGWERTVLVLNRATGKPSDLPFDILQHRWPIEFHLTEHTQSRAKRYESLRDALIEAISDCESHTLTRAREMALSLDTGTLSLVAANEHAELIDMPMPGRTMGQVLTETQRIPAYRRLLDLGAIVITTDPTIGYRWTADGRRMINALNKEQPMLLHILRTPPPQTT